MAQWFYQVLSEQFGPVSEDEIRQLIDLSTLSSDDLVRHSDAARWISVGEFLEGADGTDELNDLSELSFEFAESGPTARRVAYSDADIDIPIQSTTTEPARASAKPVAQQSEPTQEPELWFYKSLGQEMGPIGSHELIRMAEEGEITAHDEVRCGIDGQWKSPRHYPELNAALLLSTQMTEVEPALSAATLKRLGDSAGRLSTAGQSAAKTTDEASGSKPNMETKSGARNSTPAEEIPTVPKKVRVDSGSGRRKGRKSEEDLIDNILSDVLTTDADTLQKGSRRTGEMNLASQAPVAPTSSPGSSPAMSSMAASASSAAATAPRTSPSFSRPSSASIPKPHTSRKSSGGGMDLTKPLMYVAGAGVLAAAIYFGSGLLGGANLEARYMTRVDITIRSVESIDAKRSPAAFKTQQMLMKQEFEPYLAEMKAAGSSREGATLCVNALTKLLELANAKPTDVDANKAIISDIKATLTKYKAK